MQPGQSSNFELFLGSFGNRRVPEAPVLYCARVSLAYSRDVVLSNSRTGMHLPDAVSIHLCTVEPVKRIEC